MKRRLFITLFAVMVPLMVPPRAEARSAAELQLAVRKLNVVGGALYIAAHPDDENTALLSWLESERLLRTAYLSVTRGDGGQNLIGDEKGPLLGVIRTHELLAARRVDGAEQYFTRALDFGYTKNPEETLKIWNHEQVLADVVWTIRRLRPDVVITRFPITGEGGHGQHTASALLAEEAFRISGDPSRFPEQLRFVQPWQPKRIFYNRASWRPLDPNDPTLVTAIKVDLGAYNALLGRAYTEIAAVSRSEHKSQGFGSAERRGSIINYFHHRDGVAATSDLFEGIDLSWGRIPGAEAVSRLLAQVAEQFKPADPSASLPLLLEAYDALDRLAAADAARTGQQNPWLVSKKTELTEVIRDSAGLAIDVAAATSFVVPGADLPVSVTVVNRSTYPFRLEVVASRYASPGKAPGVLLENNKPVKTDISLRVPSDFATSQPYWLRRSPDKGMYAVSEQELIGLPENPQQLAIPITVSISAGQMRTLSFTMPAVYRWTDAVRGERIRNVDVVPEVTVNLASGVYVFPDRKPRPVTVLARNYGAKQATVRLLVPAGWKAEPAAAEVTFDAPGDERRLTFQLTPPAAESVDQLAVAEVELPDGKKLRTAITDLDYEHIGAQRVFGDAAAKLLRTDIARRGERIGYLMGAGDEIPGFLRQIGYTVELITDDELDRGAFSRYDAVVTGVRAYNTRRRLVLAHARLLEYVANGGTVVVQYNSLAPQRLIVDSPGPYPIKIGNERVTVEEAPVRILTPSHPLLTAPNRITPTDFNGWVQERGLYFPAEWDPKYQTVLATADPGQKEQQSGILYAKHGKGTFIYTSMAFFRQLPAGVPGAMKLFANLVSAK